MSSKRSYVKRRLRSLSREALLDVARGVHEDYPTPALGQLVASPGYRGVDGELKNLIFAANGPKPKIVRNASNQDARESWSVPHVGMPAKRVWFSRP
jgi:hypothetical protein